MATASRRRSRTISDAGHESRSNTPMSTAPQDSKRIRQSTHDVAREDGSSPNEGSERRSTTPDSDAVAVNPGPARKQRQRPQHQPGAIVRVKLTNFVTYSSAEFFPGPNLNMVIGPNGTGKSTLVCAICLGLGWGPQYLGRAKDAAEFVKHGCREATIEIELQRATRGKHASRTNPVITRNIRREGNKSTFTLNGAQSSGKAVMALAQSFDIQIDNLCQFLPQDKVVEFAQMTPIQILESTQKAAAPPQMLQYHSDLIELRRQQKIHNIDNKGAREQLANLENRQEMQRTEVERLRERAMIQKQLGWLERCRPISQFKDTKLRSVEQRAEHRRLQAELANLKSEAGPTLHKVNAKQDYVKDVQALKIDAEKNVKRATQECSRLEVEIKNLSEIMQECSDQQEAERKSETSTRQDVHREKAKLANLKRQKEQPPEEVDHRTVNREISDKTGQTRVLETKRDELINASTILKQQATPRRDERNNLHKQMEKLTTQAGQQENKLQQASSDTHRAWTWIQENQDKFKEQVYGPPIVECSLTEPARAKQIEALFQMNDFKIITAQTREDFTLLQRELIGKQRLSDISLRVCSIKSLDEFKAPIQPEQMHRHGLSGWALDYLQGPKTVVAMLCQERFLHQTAVATNDLNDEQYKSLETTNVKCCVSSIAIYRFTRRTEYGSAGVSSERRELQREPRFWSNQSTDGSRMIRLSTRAQELTEELNILKHEAETMQTEMRTIAVELKDIEAEIETLKVTKAAQQKALVEYRALDTKISQCETKIAKGEEVLATSKDRIATHQAKKDEAMIEKAEKTLLYVQAVHVLQSTHKDMLKVEVMLIEAANDFAVLSSRNQHLVDLIKQKEGEERAALEEYKKCRKVATELIDIVTNLKAEAADLDTNQGEPGLQNMIQDLGQNEGIPEKDLDELIDVERAKLNLTEGGDDNMIQEYEERARKIARLQTKLSDFMSKQRDLANAIIEVRRAWEPELDMLVAKISDAFGDSFARIGCAGQVAVFKPSSEDPVDCTEESGGTDNGLDFENWAIHISVKFRENEPLSLLDSHRQSGGERAVSTIFYLMALQSLSRAPFRVVDEINQGMDPRNERMVHGRMVDIAAADEDGETSGSQYFLITPKLLSGLKYKPGMTVLCIVSGENMPNQVDTRKKGDDGNWHTEAGHKIDFAVFARRARQLGLSRTSFQYADSHVRASTSFHDSHGSPVTEVNA